MHVLRGTTARRPRGCPLEASKRAHACAYAHLHPPELRAALRQGRCGPRNPGCAPFVHSAFTWDVARTCKWASLLFGGSRLDPDVPHAHAPLGFAIPTDKPRGRPPRRRTRLRLGWAAGLGALRGPGLRGAYMHRGYSAGQNSPLSHGLHRGIQLGRNPLYSSRHTTTCRCRQEELQTHFPGTPS